MSDKENGSNAWLAFIAGAVAGGVIGYLLASGKGKELWDELKQKVGDMKDDLGEEFNEFSEMFNDLDDNKTEENTNGKQG